MFEALFKYSPADYARSELIFAGDWPGWVVAAIAVLAVAGVTGFLWRRRRVAAWQQLLIVGALQLAMLALVLVALMQPTLTTERLREGENAVALVADTSASMGYGAEESRLHAALRNLSSVADGDASADFSIRHYELSDRAVAVDSFVDSAPDGSSSALATGLLGILEEARFNPLAAIVLSSDGDDNGGLTRDMLAEIASFGVPIHTIGVGRATIPEDLELAGVTVPGKALPGSTVSARLSIRHDAPASSRVKVYDGDDLLDIVPVELGAGSSVTTAWVDIELVDAGPHELHFTIDTIDGEFEPRNNRRSALVNVADEKYRILYYEGEPRWEYKFMRRAIADDKDVALATLLRVSPNKFYRQGIDDPTQLADGFPDSRTELYGYDALIIGSVEAASLTPEQQEMIRQFVSERGGSLLLLAGSSGLGNGGWGQTRVADVLPARLPPATADSFHRKKAPVALTPQGAASQILRLDNDPAANREAWAELPDVGDYQILGALKPAAVTLLTADTEDGEIPLLVTQPFGRGHAYILASGGTWRWQMSMPLEDMKHETFWRQVLRALVAGAPDKVTLSATAGAAANGVSLRAEFRDDEFRPVGDVTVMTVVSHEGGTTITLPMRPDEQEAGVYSAEFRPPQSGTWYFEAMAERDGELVATGRTSLLYESGSAEYFGLRRNDALLSRLSEATGGRHFDADQLDGLQDLLRYSSAGITETEYRAIWDAPALFLMLLLLKAGEWLLRRRWRTI